MCVSPLVKKKKKKTRQNCGRRFLLLLYLCSVLHFDYLP